MMSCDSERKQHLIRMLTIFCLSLEAYPGDRRSPAYDRRYSGSPGSPPRGDGRRGGSPPMQDMRQ